MGSLRPNIQTKKEPPKKRDLPKENTHEQKTSTIDLEALLNRINNLESKSEVVDELHEEIKRRDEEITNLKTTIKLAKVAWLGFRKTIRKVCDPAHKDRVTTLSVLDEYFEVSDDERKNFGG